MRPVDSNSLASTSELAEAVAGAPAGAGVLDQMAMAFMTSTLGIVVTDPGTGVMTLVNPAFARMHGGAVEDYLGKPLASVCTAESAARSGAALAAAPVEEKDEEALVTYEAEHVRADGSTFRASTEVFAAHDGEGRLLYRTGHVTDLTARGDFEDDRRALEVRFETAFSDAPIGMTLVALDGHFLKTNRALSELTGYSQAELQDRTFQDITHPDDLDADLAHVAQLIDGQGDSYRMEKRYLNKQGAIIWILLSVSIVRDDRRRPLYFISQIQDITERKRTEAYLHRLADHDALTGLWNRRRFEEELIRQIGRANRYGERAALLYIDLDEFKQVNDTLGHKVGDDLLGVIGRRMAARIRREDSCARIGGDEFAVILANVTPEQAEALAHEFASLIRESTLAVAAQTIQCTGSVGLVNINADTASEQDVLVAADIAMYAAKGAGGDRMSVSARERPT
jgi:diguanylate cyclase (GGDEF)-like protein/PAS domain S-box-containing protein